VFEMCAHCASSVRDWKLRDSGGGQSGSRRVTRRPGFSRRPDGVREMLDAVARLADEPRPAGSFPYVSPDRRRLRIRRYRVMYNITAETAPVWHLGRAWAGSSGEGIPQTDGFRTLSRALARYRRPFPSRGISNVYTSEPWWGGWGSNPQPASADVRPMLGWTDVTDGRNPLSWLRAPLHLRDRRGALVPGCLPHTRAPARGSTGATRRLERDRGFSANLQAKPPGSWSVACGRRVAVKGGCLCPRLPRPG